MHWEWLVPVIFLIVWIVSSLIQGAERERARNNRPRSLPGGDRPSGDRPSRRPPTDIDRFLEEVNRRRRQAAERGPAPTGGEKKTISTVGSVPGAVRPRVVERPRPTGRVQPVPARPGKILDAIPVTGKTAAAEILAVASALQAPPAASSAAPSATANRPSAAADGEAS